MARGAGACWLNNKTPCKNGKHKSHSFVVHRAQDDRGWHKCNAQNYGIDIKYFLYALARRVVTVKLRVPM